MDRFRGIWSEFATRDKKGAQGSEREVRRAFVRFKGFHGYPKYKEKR
jgi:hypothetical protein